MKTSQFLRAAFPITLALLMMAFLTPTARADTATFAITSAGSSGSLGGVDTSPYNGSINGGPTIPAICDDFVNEIIPPTSWTANVTVVSSLTATATNPPKYAGASSGAETYNSVLYNGWNLNQAQAYAVAASLATQILQAATGSLQQEELSFSLWELFDPGAIGHISDGGQQQAAIGYLEATIAAAPSAANYSNVDIYTYDGTSTITCGSGSCPTPPQEFIVVTPEPASMLLFGTGLLGIAFIMRKRFQKDALL